MKLQNLKVSDVMSTALITAKERDTINHADIEMRLAQIRHLPVVDDRGHVVGVVSNRDIFRALGQGSRKAVPVAEIMSRNVQTVRPEMPAHAAAEVLLSYGFGSLPVVNEDEQLVGIVTETDLIHVAYQALSGRTYEGRAMGD
ncbi:MAG: CBS domain-containing protein [Deltaproteobacteria bacterium]|nr:CBS domain-containing protein [Deltaproteobacteria bacterium]